MFTLQREQSTASSTPGSLSFDGAFLCHTLEDVVRERKVPGQTAIPSGKYALVIDYSVRFARLAPHVLGVPGFDGIRIHGGNTSADTEGCILVGLERDNDNRIHNCAPAVQMVMDRIIAAKQLGPVQITILPAL